ncbi:MAG TPA: L,D-transpeptidase family protein, partial [Xanthobacteraceae bacterium]|nr:L,D-transpeptidase family protein [Xanthobacteraceae bacterium]
MPGIRVDRFLASTAIALLLSFIGGATFADPAGSSRDAATPQTTATSPAPESEKTANPAGAETAQKPQAESPAATTDSNESTGTVTPAASDAPTTAGAATTPPAAAETKPAETTPAEVKPAADAKPPPDTDKSGAAAESKPAEIKPTEPSSGTVANPPSATGPEAAPAPIAAAVTGPDGPIADQLRDLANGKFDHIIGDKKDRTEIDAFYSGRSYAPLWITDGNANARAKAAVNYLAHVDADGLDPADYPVPNFKALSTPADLADAEIKLTMAVVTYAHHASVGRVHWSRVSADIEYATKAPEPDEMLRAIAGASDVAATLDSYEPHTPGYLLLKARLADIRDGMKAAIGNGPVLKIGMSDDRVPALRDRLGIAASDGTAYDKTVADAVKKFQQQHDLAVTGTLTAATVEALNGRQPDRITDIILANMERWRWMPHQFPDTYVIVNLPDFTLRVIHDGKQVWTTRIVIGKPEMPTPIMTADMKYITINPTWNVPPSIVNREYLPALAQDPTVLGRMGLRVDYGPGGVHIWQPPGDKNALGRIRFNFPNKFLVYQHDTPDKYMFALDKRAFSHGCMRVQDPAHYAEVLLSLVRPNEGYTEDRIKKMFGPNETDIQFPTFIPVNLTYQTAFVDDAGKLEFRDDVYGRDKALIAILRGSDRKVADIPVEHREDVSHRQALAIPDEPTWFGGSGRGGGYYPGGGYYGGGG